jgi:predicted NUDIX family NTP pyrophosphohydrolase
VTRVVRAALSAGLVLYRRSGSLEVLLAHPGGPFFVRREWGAWTIPKGEPGMGEGLTANGLLAVARREFEEETGHAPPSGTAIGLGSIVQRGGKTVHAWALEGDLDPSTAQSNEFEMVWPPGSSRRATFPEVDRVAWFELDEARRRIWAAQVPLLDRLEAALAESAT